MKLITILDSCQYVSDHSKHVKINYSKIEEVSTSIPIATGNWLTSNPYGVLDLELKDLYMFLLILQSVDFSYWGYVKWTIQDDGNNIDGFYAMICCLMKEIKRNEEFLDPIFLMNLSKEEFKKILTGNIEIPLLEERYLNLIHVATIVHNQMNNNFYEYVKNINEDEKLFRIIVDYFPCFKDERYYNGKTVYFYKLAQLLVFDLLNAKKIKSGSSIHFNNLVGCADYKIPQILRGLGILEYDNELSTIVDHKKEIEVDSSYEIEIRANMIVAVDFIYKVLNKKVTHIEISDSIWLKSQDKNINLKPYHLTRTTNY